MLNSKSILTTLAITASLLLSQISSAGVPLNNLEGVGGIAFNPLAYPSGQNKDDSKTTSGDKFSIENIFSKPQFGTWYVSLGDADIDWTAIGASETLFDRLEVSYGHEIVSPNGKNIKKDNFGAKLNLIKENEWDNHFIPAVSVGAILKKTDNVSALLDSDGQDYYVVATKLITEAPKPILVSGGLLSTDGHATGVLGYDKDRDITVFGNIDVIPFSKVAVGLEYKQGAKFDDYKDADYWNAHVAYFANKNLTLVGAYVNAGDEKSTNKVGLGDGFVLSAQYAF
jgi:hypothetical protein